MYYHCRQMKYVEYAKVYPAPIETYDKWDMDMYGWLGHHCGFSPQVWLSRGRSAITGYRSCDILKKRKYVQCKRQIAKANNDSVLFGFEIIKGFAVSYRHWEYLMNSVGNEHGGLEKQNLEIARHFNDIIGYYEEDNEEVDDGPLKDWLASGRNLEIYLKKYVFKEVDQVVLPSLNLKSAKKIICQNERQKKKLRKMGFIEDRIKIKNLKKWDW